MKILISPAKKMREDVDSLPYADLPAFLPKTEEILRTLQAMSYESLKSLWKCSDAIARQNVQRLEQMDLRHHLTPALLAYEGIQYRYMAPGVFSEQALACMYSSTCGFCPVFTESCGLLTGLRPIGWKCKPNWP